MADSNSEDHHSAYPYNPATWAAVLFAILFGIALILHVYQLIRYKTGYMWVMIVAVALEVIGFVMRVISIHHDSTFVVVLAQTGLVVAPAFMAAQDYMIIGRLMSYVGKEYGYINHTKITATFVGADVFAILTQASGGGLLAGANGNLDRMQLAQEVLLFGLALQVVTFGIFAFAAIAFDIRSSRSPSLRLFKEEMKSMRKLWLAFYISSFLITLRSIYRTVEFGDLKLTAGSFNAQGYVYTHEWLLYVCDSIPIFISVVFFCIYHPGRWLPTKKGLRMDGTYEDIPGS
ncbi:hypothetical protein FRB90_000098, partial [Tulasnella sp. 427]